MRETRFVGGTLWEDRVKPPKQKNVMKIQVLYSPIHQSIRLRYDGEMRHFFRENHRLCAAFCRSKVARDVARHVDPALIVQWTHSIGVLTRLKRGQTRQACLSAIEATHIFNLACIALGNSKLSRRKALEALSVFGTIAPCSIDCLPLPPLPEVLDPTGFSETTVKIYKSLAAGRGQIALPVTQAEVIWNELAAEAFRHPMLKKLVEHLESRTHSYRLALDWINNRH